VAPTTHDAGTAYAVWTRLDLRCLARILGRHSFLCSCHHIHISISAVSKPENHKRCAPVKLEVEPRVEMISL